MEAMIGLLYGFGIGIVSGVVGIGGGTLLVPLFIYVYKMNMYQAVGTSLAVIAPAAFIGAWSHYMKGNVQIAPVVWVILGSAIGMFWGGQIISFIPQVFLKRAFAVFLIIVAIKLFR